MFATTAAEGPLQQITWYACTFSGNDAALKTILCALDEGCMLVQVKNGGSLYGDALLMSANQAAGHISIARSDCMKRNVFFMMCVTNIEQVMQ